MVYPESHLVFLERDAQWEVHCSRYGAMQPKATETYRPHAGIQHTPPTVAPMWASTEPTQGNLMSPDSCIFSGISYNSFQTL